MNRLLLIALMLTLATGVAAQRQTETVENPVQTQDDGMTLKKKVAIGRFSNETQYAKGIFYDRNNDPMGKQALDILSAKLAASGKFLLLERGDLDTLLEECQKGEKTASTIGADYMIIGSITEFGRKNTGKNRVFSSEKTQTVEAAVSIRLVDVSTGLIIYSDEAKGTAEVTTKTTLGIGGQAEYDATLSDKAIAEAIGQLVECQHHQQMRRQPLEDLFPVLRCRRRSHCRWPKPGHQRRHDLCHHDSGQESEKPADRHYHHPARQESGPGEGTLYRR